MLRNILVCALLAVGAAAATACAQSSDTPGADVRHVSATQAKSLVEGDADIVVLDVRTGGEFSDGHLAGAINVNYLAPGFGTAVGELDKSKTYLVHCRSGNRSTKALKVLQQAGFQSLVHMDGGTKAWEQAGLPLVKDED